MNSQNLQNKLRDKFLKKGVKMKGPETVFFSKDTKIGKNVEIEPYVVFADKVQIGDNVKIIENDDVLTSLEIHSQKDLKIVDKLFKMRLKKEI